MMQEKIHYSLDAEQSVLGGLMLNNQAWAEINCILSAEDFYHPQHQIIFNALEKLANCERPFDILTISETLKDSNQLNEIGDEGYLFEIAHKTPSAANVRAYAETIKEKSKQRKLIQFIKKIDCQLSQGSLLEETSKELINEFYDVLNNCSNWPEPKPIKTELLPVEKLPSEIIPEPLREFIIDEAERMQSPIDFIACSILTVISSVIGAGCGIKPKKEDDWIEFPNLWGCLVGMPGKLKSPAASVAIKFLEKLELEEKKVFEDSQRDYEFQHEAFKAERDAIKTQISSSYKNKISGKKAPIITNIDELNDMYRNLKEPVKVKRKRFKTNDSTVEKLSELLGENPKGLLLFRDELMGLLATWDKMGHESDRAFFLEAWNGKGSHTSDRIGRGTVDTENLCVSIFGTTQPDKLIRYLSSAINGNNDGLIQRFQLLVYPDSPDWKMVDRKPHYEARSRVFELIQRLAYMNFTIYGAAQDDHSERPFFRFSSEAQLVFRQWLTELEQNKTKASNDHFLLIEHFGKYRKLIPALALIFHLIDLADGAQDKQISEKNIRLACAWGDYLESHARRIYGLVTDIEIRAASVLSEKILKGKLKDQFTARDVYRLKGILKRPKVARAACDELVDAGWLKEIIKPKGKGQKEQIFYLVNPQIKIGKNNG